MLRNVRCKLRPHSNLPVTDGEPHQVHEDCARHIATSARLIEVHVDAFQLQVALTLETANGVHAMLIAYYLRERTEPR